MSRRSLFRSATVAEPHFPSVIMFLLYLYCVVYVRFPCVGTVDECFYEDGNRSGMAECCGFESFYSPPLDATLYTRPHVTVVSAPLMCRLRGHVM